MDMGDKKHLGRFTVQFNLYDPQQARASDILEHQGRQKARFISAAILHYINCKETPEVTLPPTLDIAAIENIVLAILEKHAGEEFKHPMPQETLSEKATCSPQDMSVTEHDNSTDELKAMLGDGGFSAIANTLASFRQK